MAYKIKQISEPEESWLGAGARHVARSVARGAESVVGLPGDVMQFASDIGVVPEFNENMPRPLPTSGEIREKVTKPLTGQYLEPKGKGEEFSDEVASDLATFMLPIKGKLPFKGAVVRAVGGNVASLMAKEVGFGKGGQVASKIGFNLLAGIPGTRKALVKNQEILKEGFDKTIRPMEKYRTTSLDPLISKAKKVAEYGYEHKVPWKSAILDEVERLENSMSGPNYLNIKKSVALEEVLTDKLRAGEFPKKSVKTIESLRDGLKKAHHEFAKKENLEFGKYYLPWSDVDNGLNASSKIGKFVQNKTNFNFSKSNSLTRSLFLGSMGAAKVIPAAGYNLFSLLGKSNIARQAYANVMKASAAGNAATALKNMNIFDEEANKFSPEKEKGAYKIKSLG